MIPIKNASRSGPPLESDVMREVRKWLAEQSDIRVWRNNTGKLKDENGRLVTYGLAIGSSDLIGILRCHVQVTAFRDATIARFLAIELKQPGKKPTDDQERFLETVRKDGGVGFWADNLQTVKDYVERARRWEI